MLRARILTAAVLVAILLPTILFGGVVGLAAAVLVFSQIALWEMTSCLPPLRSKLGRALTLALGVAITAGVTFLPDRAMLMAVAVFPLLVLTAHVILYHKVENTIDSVSNMVFALGYVAVPLGHAILLRRLEHGAAWILFVIVVIALGDAGAYFAGKYMGKRKFSKSISPSKTIEGLIGGLAGNLAGMVVIKVLFPDLPGLTYLVPLTLLLAVVGPVGDLCASAIKRRLQIKDYGTVFPGHGGVMDRADSLIPAFPTAYYFLILTVYTGQS
jgi:phosphatidate cytidylyltransferase